MAFDVNAREYNVVNAGGDKVTVKINGSTTDYNFVFPSSVGAVNEVMVSDGNGNMSNSFHYPLKQYLGDGTDFTVSGTGWTTVRATGIPYQTSDGTWRIILNVQGTITATPDLNALSFTGTTFHTTVNNFAVGIGGVGTNFAAVGSTGGGNNIRIRSHGGGNFDTVGFIVDLELNSKPTWAD